MKKTLSCICFCLILFSLMVRVEDILIPKTTNRYYILEKHLDEIQTEFDVHVYGSCHSYTSFNPGYLKGQTGLESFVFGNAGEIIPTTYLRMIEQFKKHTPKIAIVEVWGINPYETYDSTEKILGSYFQSNIQLLPLSLEKLEVINDFDTLDMLEMCFTISRYKDRIMDESLRELDFDYAFEKVVSVSTDYVVSEMTSRMENNGIKLVQTYPVPEYKARQIVIDKNDFMEIEPDIVKYIVKIMELCEAHDVELIFYRSPYIAKVNELKKLNHFHQICDEHGVLFLDLEQEINYDYYNDFYDYQHLSEAGANKSTEYLIPYILEAMK